MGLNYLCGSLAWFCRSLFTPCSARITTITQTVEVVVSELGLGHSLRRIGSAVRHLPSPLGGMGGPRGPTSSEMDVLYDAQIFLRQRRGGISRLFSQLISQFDADPGLEVSVKLPFHWSNNDHVTHNLSHRRLRRSPSWLPREVLYGAHLLRRSVGPSPLSLVHHTYYSRLFLHDWGRTARVVTVHDMIPELFAGTQYATRSHLQKREYVATCDLVICVSDSTRHDMEAVYGNLARNVVTIPNSVDPLFQPSLARISSLPEDYLLYVGKRSGYKDFDLLAPAIAKMRADGLAVPVVAAGAGFTRSEIDYLKRWRVADLFSTRELADIDLARAYANATLLVQTSRYEGFGLTPLEGMASGTPVVIADASSMPEVGGDVAFYFTPGDSEDLAHVLSSVLNSDELRAAASDRGVERARQFAPDLMAERTAVAYRSILENV